MSGDLRGGAFAKEETGVPRYIRYLAGVATVCFALPLAPLAASVLSVEVSSRDGPSPFWLNKIAETDEGALRGMCDESWLNKTVRWHGRTVAYTGTSYEVLIDPAEGACLLPRDAKVLVDLPDGFPSCDGKPTARSGDSLWFEGAIQSIRVGQITIHAHRLDFGIGAQHDSWEAFRRNCGTNAVKRNPCLAQGVFQAHYVSKGVRQWQGKVLSVRTGEIEVKMFPSDSTLADLVLSFDPEEYDPTKDRFVNVGRGNKLAFSAQFAQLTDGSELSTRMDDTTFHPKGLLRPEATWEQFIQVCGERASESIKRQPKSRDLTQREFDRLFKNRRVSWVGHVFDATQEWIAVKMEPSQSPMHDVWVRLGATPRRLLPKGHPIIFTGEVAVCGALNSSSVHEVVADHVESQFHRGEEL